MINIKIPISISKINIICTNCKCYVDTNVGEYACMSSVKVLSTGTFKRAKHACPSTE